MQLKKRKKIWVTRNCSQRQRTTIHAEIILEPGDKPQKGLTLLPQKNGEIERGNETILKTLRRESAVIPVQGYPTYCHLRITRRTTDGEETARQTSSSWILQRPPNGNILATATVKRNSSVKRNMQTAQEWPFRRMWQSAIKEDKWKQAFTEIWARTISGMLSSYKTHFGTKLLNLNQLTKGGRSAITPNRAASATEIG